MASKDIFNDLNLVIRLNQHIQNIGDAASLARQTSFKVLTELSALENPDPREDVQFDHQRTGFLSGNTLELPFHLQGDHEFNEASAMAKRRALRHSESIQQKISFLWSVAREKKSSIQRTASAELRLQSSTFPHSPLTDEIDESDYVAMMLLIFKVLRDDFVLEQAKTQIHYDWEVDSHHGKTLNRDLFFAALFELVDVWTCDILEPTYVRFLELLTRRITLRVIVFLDNQILKLALSDNFDAAVVVKAIPLSTIQKFVPVTKVVEAKGLQTIGELASADPVVVESERRKYLEKNKYSKNKIGEELMHLITMFNGLSEQFERSNYRLENNVLTKTQAPGTIRNQDSFLDNDEHEISAASSKSSSCPQMNKIGASSIDAPIVGDGGITRNYRGKVAADEIVNPNNCLSAHIGSGNAMHPDSCKSTSQTNTSVHVTNSPISGTVPRRLGLKRFNTIHDLSVEDSSVINAVRNTYIIEKGISIQRQTEPEAIQRELEKFGLDLKSTPLSNNDMEEKYGSLYEMFILRDGESIKSLAQSVLAQIKLELAAHGIEVKDMDAESMYDGFYNSVVIGTGEKMVEDAKNWMNETIKSNALSSYVKNDYHEFKPLENVEQLGSQPGDEEFLSLITKEQDTNDELLTALTEMKPASTPSILLQTTSTKATVVESDIVPKTLSTVFDESRPVAIFSAEKSKNPLPIPPSSLPRRSGPRRDRTQLDISSASRDNKKIEAAKKLQDKPSIDNARADSELLSHEQPPEAELSVAPVAIAIQSEVAVVEKKNILEWGEAIDPGDAEVQNIVVIEASTVNVPVDPVRPVEMASLKERLQMQLKPSRPQLHVSIDPPNYERKTTDISNLNLLYETQGIGFGYEEELTELTEVRPEPHVDGSTVLVPKIPKIIVGGLSSATNVTVAGRYIQLLGLGHVLITKEEEELLQLLQSDDGKDTDLVCFDIGSKLDVAVEKLQILQDMVGKRVILFGGDEHDQAKTQMVVEECLSLGALYFARLPLDFPSLRTQILSFFENSTQPYIIRQRKSLGRTAATLKIVSRSIDAAHHFTLNEDSRTLSTPLSYARTSKRKISTALPVLPAVMNQAARISSLKAVNEIQEAELPTPVSPMSPRSLKSYKKSPRLSSVLKKMIR